MRTFGSPKTPRTTGSARNPSNEYVSQSRRRRFDILAIQHLCQIFNPAKMQNIPEIPRSTTLQALKFTHLIPRRPIILTTAAVLNAGGVTNIRSAAEAAEALRPLAGDLTFVLFALGIIGAGLLAVPVLAGSAAYCVSEAFGWPATLEAKRRMPSAFTALLPPPRW
jgi:hypothetical protein